jgi:glycerol-3-phosphate dehydrogenase
MCGFRRQESLGELGNQTFDLLVIGGGMTGAGVAVDAATRGLKVALVEKGDFASGTSSKSSKMVHGGLRYLQQREVGLVYENLHERQRLLNNAPHLVEPLPFLIPLFGNDGVVSKAVARSYRSALWLYDVTGGLRIGKRHKEITRAQVIEHFPSLNVSKLVAGFLYYDARGDDARVCLTLLRTAADRGAVIANYVEATKFIHDASGRVVGAKVKSTARGERAKAIEVRARVVVNAAGVFADSVSSLEEGIEAETITPAKGVHLSVPAERLPCDVAAVIPVVKDRRSIFVVPWEEGPYVYIGTTDTAYDGDLDEPRCEPEDVAYLLDAVNAVTSADLTPADVTGVWAGLRPLLKPAQGRKISERTADLSRRHKVETLREGVVLVTGGKWTTYRQMAEDTMDEVARQLPGIGASATRSLPLHGATTKQPPLTSIDAGLAEHLYHRYGSDAVAVAALIADDPSLADPCIKTLPYVVADVVYAVRCEMAIHLADVLARRTRAQLQNARATRDAAEKVASIMGKELGWTKKRREAEIEDFVEMVNKELREAGLKKQQAKVA